MTTTPCPTPEVCGVKNHRPGTESACRATKRGAPKAKSQLTSYPKPQTKAASHDEVPVGQETMREDRAFARDRALFVDAGDESFMVLMEDLPHELHPQGEALILTSGAMELKKDSGYAVEELAVPVYQNYDGELWVQQNSGDGTLYMEAVKLSDLSEGDAHPIEEEWDLRPEDGDRFDIYKACRRLESNPDAKLWMQKNARIVDPVGRDGKAGAYVKPSR